MKSNSRFSPEFAARLRLRRARMRDELTDEALSTLRQRNVTIAASISGPEGLPSNSALHYVVFDDEDRNNAFAASYNREMFKKL